MLSFYRLLGPNHDLGCKVKKVGQQTALETDLTLLCHHTYHLIFADCFYNVGSPTNDLMKEKETLEDSTMEKAHRAQSLYC